MSLSAQTHLKTLFVLDGQRIVSTREPNPSSGPAFSLIRRADSCAWALGSRISAEQAKELTRLASDERPTDDFPQPPRHLEEYKQIVGGTVASGPAFEFRELGPASDGVATIEDVEMLLRSFDGWTAEEVPGRMPMMGVVEDGRIRSVCFCSRISETAAEAGVETAQEFRGRGLAGLVTTAWARAIIASGRNPVYSTSWTNGPSLAVARKLKLVACASYWHFTAEGRGGDAVRTPIGASFLKGDIIRLLTINYGRQDPNGVVAEVQVVPGRWLWHCRPVRQRSGISVPPENA